MNTGKGIAAQEIIRTVEKLPKGSTLPKEGPCLVLYAKVNSPGDTVILKGKKEYALVHFDYDAEYLDLDEKKCGWQVATEGSRTAVTMIFNQAGSPYVMSLSLHHSLDENMQFLDYLKSGKPVTVYFLSFIYGEIVKEKTSRLKMPKNAAGGITI